MAENTGVFEMEIDDIEVGSLHELEAEASRSVTISSL